MSRFANAPWTLKALYSSAAATLAIAAWMVLAATVTLAGLGQLSASVEPAAVPAWLWYFRQDPEVRRWLGVGAGAATLLLLIAGAAVLQGVKRPLHGAARWAGEAEIRRAELRARRGIVLGRKAGRPLVFGGAEHVVLYAPTRSGKGVGVVIPNLLTWTDSVVVLDVKRENWEATAGWRAAQGQQVLLFDPLDPEGCTARYNPLGHIDRSDPIAVLDELQRIAGMLFPAPPAADPFWVDSARTGFVGVGALLAAEPDSPLCLGAIYGELTRGDPRTTLPRRLAALVAEGRPVSAGCRAALADFCSASDNTFASVRQTLTSRLNLWLNPRVCAATAASDFDLAALRSRRTSLYLAASPENLGRVAPLYNLLFQQLVDLSCRQRPSPSRHPYQVLLLLDEFARLGHAPVLARAFAYVAGYGLRLLPVLQSTAQLRGEYGPELTEEILANCAVEIVFAPKALKTANELSERLGYASVRSASRSRPTGLSKGSRSISESDQRRALMLPQELTQLAADRLILLKAGIPPVAGRKIVYYRERFFRDRLYEPPAVLPSPTDDAGPRPAVAEADPLSLEGLVSAPGLEPLPPKGASVEEVERWVERYIDASALPARDPLRV